MAEDEILWTAGFFNERFPAPVSPLAWSMLGPLIEETALRDPLRFLGYPQAETIPLTRLWRGHPYTNVRAFQIFYKVFPDYILPEDSYRYFPEGDPSLRKYAPYPHSIFSPRFLFSILRAFIADWQNFSPLHNYRKWARYTREHDRRVDALRDQFDSLQSSGACETFDALRDTESVHRDFLRIHRWSLMHADLTFGLLKRLARAWIDREHGGEIAARWVAGAPNKTMEVDAALRKLAIGNSQFTMDDFLAEHGHRSFSLDIAVPTFADDGGQVERLMHGLNGTQTNHALSEAEGTDEHRKRKQLPRLFWQRWIFNLVHQLAVKYVALREDQRYYWQKSLAVSRHLYLVLADKLVADGVLGKRDDVFYAIHAELADYFESRLTKEALARSVAARQAEWDAYRRESAYPLFLRGDVPLASTAAKRQIWQARATSPGIARGLARVVQSAEELGTVQRGEILIAPSTDPAWTPVFAKIAGLVLERGGVLSHSAVVAREYNVPAVAGIANIANEIQNGEMIEVDGNKGIVTRV